MIYPPAHMRGVFLGAFLPPSGAKRKGLLSFDNVLWGCYIIYVERENRHLHFDNLMELYMITFNEAQTLIQSARNPSKGKPIYSLPHTRVVLIQGTVDSPEILGIRYYNTNIVSLYPNGTYSAKICSWNTRTTKKRINALTPLNVRQRDGVWYHNSDPFYSGIMVNQDGSVIEDNAVMSK